MTSQRRPRRSTPEVRRLVLEAARACFAERGFAGATTSAIAQSADVSERVLFRHFPTKEQLFEAAVVEPFNDFIRRFSDLWADLPADGLAADALMRRFAADLYDVVRAHREVVEAFLSRQPAPRLLTEELSSIDAVADRFAAAHDLTYDTVVSVRTLFLLVVSAARYQELIFGADDDPTRDRVVREIGDMIVHHALWPRRFDG